MTRTAPAIPAVCSHYAQLASAATRIAERRDRDYRLLIDAGIKPDMARAIADGAAL